MLKKISQEELDEILRRHRLWLISDSMGGERADLSYHDLSGMDLRGANLTFLSKNSPIFYKWEMNC